MRLYYYTSKRYGLKSLYEKRLKIAIFPELNDPFELYPFERGNVKMRRLWRQYVQKTYHATGIICFSASWQTTLMWAHYCEKGHGIVLGFDIPEQLPTKIGYVRDRLPNPFKLQTLAETLNAVGDHPLATKYIGWEYEQEYRLHARLEEAIDGIYYRKFDEILLLREVVIGERCELRASDVRDAIGQPIADVAIKKARASFNRFEICAQRQAKPEIVKGIEPEALRAQKLAKLLLTEVNAPTNVPV
jgi:hypothetical protein